MPPNDIGRVVDAKRQLLLSGVYYPLHGSLPSCAAFSQRPSALNESKTLAATQLRGSFSMGCDCLKSYDIVFLAL